MEKKFDIFYDADNSFYQIRTKNNAVIIEFDSSNKESLFKDVIELYNKQSFYTFQMLNNSLKSKYEYNDVYDVIGELLTCGLLNFENFEDDGLFSDLLPNSSAYYKVNADISSKKVGFIGDKSLMSKVISNLQIQKVNSTFFLNTEEKISKAEITDIFSKCDFVVADEIHWNPILMEQINETGLIENKPWMLIEGMIDFVHMSFGPIFHGKITGCYNCYKSRLLSNDVNSKYTQSYERYLKREEKTAKADIIPEIYQNMLAFYVSLDILKFISESAVPLTWRNEMIINKGDYSNNRHFFLKSPICPVCKVGLDYTPSAWYESINV